MGAALLPVAIGLGVAGLGASAYGMKKAFDAKTPRPSAYPQMPEAITNPDATESDALKAELEKARKRRGRASTLLTEPVATDISPATYRPTLLGQ